jgi:quercetin dioxygenase-like cupin family protein
MTALENEWQAAEPGIRRRIREDGEKLMFVEVHFEPGAVGNVHSHPHEQAVYVLQGSVRLTIDGQPRDLKVGDTCRIPSNVVHNAVALEESLLLDVFSPPRSDFRY